MSELWDAWWEAADARRLVVQRCAACGAHQHYPRPFCVACGAEDVAFVDALGTGRVHSFTVAHRPAGSAFADEVPYVVAIVELDEGPRMVTNLVGAPVDSWACDEAVTVSWVERDGRTLPVFTRP